MVPKCSGSLRPILFPKQFNHYMYISTFKMLTIRQIWQCIQKGYPFLLISRVLICTFLFLSITIIIYILFGKINLTSRKFCHLHWPQPLGFSPNFLNLYCSFGDARMFVSLYIWTISWSWFALSVWARGHSCFILPIGLSWVKHFPSLNLFELSSFF